jgi:5-methylcytosine-specific restriction endonuclease McrA
VRRASVLVQHGHLSSAVERAGNLAVARVLVYRPCRRSSRRRPPSAERLVRVPAVSPTLDHLDVGISDHTRRALWGRSGGVCARCKDTLIHEASPVDREALVGEEAHIVSGAAAGPRHGPEPNGGYDGLENLILLCRVCHAIVDGQPATYPIYALRALRDGHVRWVKTRTGSEQLLPRLRFSPIPADLELTLVTSGQQLVDLLSGAEDVSFRHDQR